MNLHGQIFNASTILLLVMLGSGCASSPPISATPSLLSPVEACDAKKVTVTGLHWFKDLVGAWRVVGTINNNTSQSISDVVTGVETYTKANQPADQGEDVNAYPLNLQPGAQAPFSAWIDRDIPGLDHFAVEVDECVVTEPAERSQVDVRGGRMVVDDNGSAQVTAELHNPGSQTVLVNGLMAGVYDQAGAPVTAEYVAVGPRDLGPGESGPVRASLDLPPGGAT